METRGTTGEETISYWFDLPIDVAEFEEKLGVGAESGDYRIIEKVLPYADEVHEHTSVYQLNELDFMYRQLSSDMQEEYTALLTVYENLRVSGTWKKSCMQSMTLTCPFPLPLHRLHGL